MLAPAGPVALAGLGLGAGSGAAQCAAQGLPAGSQACLNLIASGAGSGGYLLDGYNHIKYDAVTYYLIG